MVKFFLILIPILLIGCKSNVAKVRPPKCSLVANVNITFDNDIYIKTKEVSRGDKIVENIIILNGDTIEKTKDVITLRNAQLKYGNNHIKYVVKDSKGNIGESSTTIVKISKAAPKILEYSILDQIPHSTEDFTQGLEIHNGSIYEGTGEFGKSKLYKKSLKNGEVLMEQSIENKYFGEGITITNDKLYQLTYLSGKGLVYNLKDFSFIREFNLPSKEGWGLTKDSTSTKLFLSDGTETIYTLDVNTLKVISSFKVSNNRGLVSNINELEYVNGYLYANIWLTDTIVKIDPQSGIIVATVDCSTLLSQSKYPYNEVDVLNGIAYDADKDIFLLTGKNWSSIFKVKLSEKGKV